MFVYTNIQLQYDPGLITVAVGSTAVSHMCDNGYRLIVKAFHEQQKIHIIKQIQ